MGKRLILSCLAVLIVPSLVHGYFTQNYGDRIGTTMEFLQVTETSFTDSRALFGAPSVLGDTLEFRSMGGFYAFASNGSSDLTDGKLQATIRSKNNPKYYIDRIKFEEFGDTSLGGTGDASTYTSVGNALFVQIREINDVAITPFTISVNMSFSPKNSWNLTNDGVLSAQLWSGIVEVDLTQELRDRGLSGFVTLVDITMDNTLNAGSQPGTNALIVKKENNGLRVTPMVPEPATISLFALGCLTLLRKRRR